MGTQTTEEDAVNALIPGLTAAAVMEMVEDPSSCAAFARGVWYEQQVMLRAQQDHLTTPQRLEWIKHLGKVAGLDAAPVSDPVQKEMPSINIIFKSRPEKNMTIEGQARVTGEPADD